MRNLIIFLLFMSITACSTPIVDEVAKEICDGASNCTYRCPDGTITDARYPVCPINDRDLLPPANDNIGLEGLGQID
ncbi:MAG: hypothetical protein COB54_04345 [Alphaproteobacteria bacterium]|nr:MAG: hypothetical protein COB54_04345 [Alphaproteobacteria bacterium]